MFTAYAEIATDLAVNIAAIFLLAYVLYFRRHRRADLLLAYVALNIGIFVAISLLTTVRVDIAHGLDEADSAFTINLNIGADL